MALNNYKIINRKRKPWISEMNSDLHGFYVYVLLDLFCLLN